MYSKREELWNTWSHFPGIMLGIAGLVLLLVFDSEKTAYSTMSILFYAISIIMLYSASTIYHAVSNIKWKSIFRKIDHICIYFLIAGTYTPVALISLEKSSGWPIFWTVWIICAVGTVLKVFFTGKFEAISLILYLAMGWLIAFDFGSLMEVQSDLGMLLMMLGGACYTVGILFYAIRKIPYNHTIWHLFVLAGSTFHFFFILLDVI